MVYGSLSMPAISRTGWFSRKASLNEDYKLIIRGDTIMKRFLKLYITEQKLALRSADLLIFGVIMPVGILVLINMIAGQKQAVEGVTYLQSSFASLITVGICAAAFMGLPLTVADYRDKKILKHFFTTPCSPMWILGSVMLCAGVTALYRLHLFP